MRNLLNLYINISLLRREPYYHKIQYSKVPKYDIAAALLGVIIGAFVVYLSLSTFGTSSPDLSDLTVFLWYLFIFFKIFKYSFFSYSNESIFFLFTSFFLILSNMFNYGWIL